MPRPRRDSPALPAAVHVRVVPASEGEADTRVRLRNGISPPACFDATARVPFAFRHDPIVLATAVSPTHGPPSPRVHAWSVGCHRSPDLVPPPRVRTRWSFVHATPRPNPVPTARPFECMRVRVGRQRLSDGSRQGVRAGDFDESSANPREAFSLRILADFPSLHRAIPPPNTRFTGPARSY